MSENDDYTWEFHVGFPNEFKDEEPEMVMEERAGADRMTVLELTEDELRLVAKLVEANDTGGVGRQGRFGAYRVRMTLAVKLLQAKDSLVGIDEKPTE